MKQNVKTRSIFFVLFFLIFVCGILVIAVTGNNKIVIRKPAVAGAFYPGDTKELDSLIDQFIENVKEVRVDGNIIGLVVPHAGYAYSAKTAAVGYKSVLNKKYDILCLKWFKQVLYLTNAI